MTVSIDGMNDTVFSYAETGDFIEYKAMGVSVSHLSACDHIKHAGIGANTGENVSGEDFCH